MSEITRIKKNMATIERNITKCGPTIYLAKCDMLWAYSQASTANKAFAIIIGIWAFGTVLTANQVIGLMICIAGALWFAVEQKADEPNLLFRKSHCHAVPYVVPHVKQADPFP